MNLTKKKITEVLKLMTNSADAVSDWTHYFYNAAMNEQWMSNEWVVFEVEVFFSGNDHLIEFHLTESVDRKFLKI